MRIDTRSYLFRAVVLGTLLVVASLFAVGGNEQVGAPNAHDEAYGETKNVGPHKSLWVRTLDDAPGFWTAVLAGLTLVLAGVGVGQIYYLRRADETTRLTADAAMKAATAAERTIDSAEAPFLVPTIIADTISVTEDGFVKSVGLGKMFEFEYRNIGRTPAILIDVYSSPYFTIGLPTPLDDLVLHTGGLRTEVVASGDKSSVQSFGLNASLHEYYFGSRLGSGHAEVLSAQIHARYADLFGNEFIGRSCFVYASGRREWYCIGGTEYNYRRKVNWPEPIRVADRRPS